MKLLKRISLFFVIPMGILCIGILVGMTISSYFYPGKVSDKVPELNMIPLQTQTQTQTQNQVVSTTEPEEEVIVEADASDKLLLNAQTLYVVEETDIIDGTVVETTLKLPDKYIGMNREEFVSSMEVYEMSPPLKEQEKGFIGLEVLSFSPEKVVVQMNYALEKMLNDYYILVEDHYLVVYMGDKKTLYMYTEIKLDELPQTVQQEIINGMYMESEEKLFDFLESYSS